MNILNEIIEVGHYKNVTANEFLTNIQLRT